MTRPLTARPLLIWPYFRRFDRDPEETTPAMLDQAVILARERLEEALAAYTQAGHDAAPERGEAAFARLVAEAEIRRLREEPEVLEWKKRRLLDPDCEVPVPMRKKFETYQDHPPLPEACLAGTRHGELVVWDHVIDATTGETMAEMLDRRAARMRQVQVNLVTLRQAVIRAGYATPELIDEGARLLDEETSLWLKWHEPHLLRGDVAMRFFYEPIMQLKDMKRAVREAGRTDELRRVEEEIEWVRDTVQKARFPPDGVAEHYWQVTQPEAVQPPTPESTELPFDH